MTHGHALALRRVMISRRHRERTDQSLDRLDALEAALDLQPLALADARDLVVELRVGTRLLCARLDAIRGGAPL